MAAGVRKRRLAGRTAREGFEEEIRFACGPYQYAVGRQAGCELERRALVALAEATPSAAVLAFEKRGFHRHCSVHNVEHWAEYL